MRKAPSRAMSVILLGALTACVGALFTAPPNSTLILNANPGFIPSHGGVSVITAFVTEPAGTAVADGTVVQFFSDLGQVPRQAKTKDGFARVNFVSDSRSGLATITAVSGGEAAAPAPSSPPSATPPPSPSPRPVRAASLSGGAGLSSGAGLSGATAVQATDTVTVTIGNVNVATVRLRAEPPRITISNSTHVIATVWDRAGNPVANVPVFFEVVSDKSTEFFDIQGPIHTNNNGEAENVMRTRRNFTGAATVQAVAAGGPGTVTSAPLSIPIL